MSRKRHKPEEIVAKLRPVDVLTAQGTPVADAVRSIGVTEVASGRVAGWGDLLLTPRGADRHRELATSLQHGPPACFSGLPATGPGGVRASLRRMAGCATPTGSAGHAPGGAQTDHELTFKPDHPRGADQPGSDKRGLRPMSGSKRACARRPPPTSASLLSLSSGPYGPEPMRRSRW
jgi:hypothetical protein